MWSDPRLPAAICVALMAAPAAVRAQEANAPASAIGWLRDGMNTPAPVIEPGAAQSATTPEVTTTTLGGVRRDGVGLLSARATGLPRDLFAGSDPARLQALIGSMRASPLPAIQDLALTLLLAEVDAPRAGAVDDGFLLARVDRLVAFGGLEQAQALLEAADPATPALFGRWLDISLLTGNDAPACASLRAAPSLVRDLSPRAYCLSRGDDWAAASLVLETGRVLGAIAADDAALLAWFLDPEAFEGSAPLPATLLRTGDMTPLRFRLLDGIGETPATAPLPLAYATADLRDTIGWKAQIEAAERLARVQAIGAEQMRALYTERMPAASGGVWDRAEAFQRFETALASGDPGATANALPGAWAAMSAAGLQVAFAQTFGAALGRLPLPPAATVLALKIGLLSRSYEDVARAADVTTLLPRDAFAVSIALGTPVSPRGLGPLGQAIADGFAATQTPAPYAELVSHGRLGEALLEAVAALDDGVRSDPDDIAGALALLRTVGLMDVARRAALQLLLMDARA
jgi:hypothetical protein